MPMAFMQAGRVLPRDHWATSYDGVMGRFKRHFLEDPRIHGQKRDELPYKAACPFLFEQLLREGHLDPSVFTNPDFLIATPDLIAGDVPPQAYDAGYRPVRDNPNLKRFCDEVVLPHFQNQESIMVRSLGAIEGGPSKSAAGVFHSEHHYMKYPLVEPLEKVIDSAFTPFARLTASRFGRAGPDWPGILFQAYSGSISPEHDAIFNTSARNFLAGRLSFFFSTLFRQKLGEPSTIVYHTKWGEVVTYDLPIMAIIHEVAGILSSGGVIPVEIEMGWQLEEGKPEISLVQHRFVTPLEIQARPTEKNLVMQANAVSGGATVQCNNLVLIEFNENSHSPEAALLALWLLDKSLCRQGGYVLWIGEQAKKGGISNDIFWPRGLGLDYRAHYLNAGAVIDMYPYNRELSHYWRYMADLNVPYLEGPPEYDKIPRGEEIFADFSQWDPADMIYMPPDVRDYLRKNKPKKIQSDLRNCGIKAYALPKPMTVVADELNQWGGVWI